MTLRRAFPICISIFYHDDFSRRRRIIRPHISVRRDDDRHHSILRAWPIPHLSYRPAIADILHRLVAANKSPRHRLTFTTDLPRLSKYAKIAFAVATWSACGTLARLRAVIGADITEKMGADIICGRLAVLMRAAMLMMAAIMSPMPA